MQGIGREMESGGDSRENRDTLPRIGPVLFVPPQLHRQPQEQSMSDRIDWYYHRKG